MWDQILGLLLPFHSAVSDHQHAPSCQRPPWMPALRSPPRTPKKEVVENGRETPANGDANEKNREQETDPEVDKKRRKVRRKRRRRKVMVRKRMEMKIRRLSSSGKGAAEDDEHDDIDTKKQKTDEEDWTAKNKLDLKKKKK
uniref:Prothymosin alpha n=2 Tax=Sus scrofa TaxID=9823 RepID=A0A5G2RBH8_PIG